MPKRLVVGAITLSRETRDVTEVINGQNVTRKQAVPIRPNVGEVFEFTAEELDYINEHNPGAIRHPRNDEEDRASSLVVDPTSARNEVDEQKVKDVKTVGGTKKDASDL